MKPFNLNDFKSGKKVVTRDGREVKQLTVFDGLEYCLCGLVDKETEIRTWRSDGIFFRGSSCADLFHPDEEMYVNVFNGNGFAYTGNSLHPSVEKALSYMDCSNYVGTYKLVKVD